MSIAPRLITGETNQISETLSQLDKVVLELIMARRPLASVLETLCLRIEERSPDLVCSVLLLEGDGTTLRDGAGPSLPAVYRNAIDGCQIGPAVGSCGTAAYRRQPVIVADIEHDPLWAN